MEYDQDIFDVIEADPRFIEQTHHSRVNKTKNKIVDNDLIEFYSSKDEYGKWLSNCVYAMINIGGKAYRSSEHYYQMSKYKMPDNDPNFMKWCEYQRFTSEQGQHVLNTVIDMMSMMTPVQVAKYGQTNRENPI